MEQPKFKRIFNSFHNYNRPARFACDAFVKRGANMLAKKIQDYWLAMGMRPVVAVEEMTDKNRLSPLYQIRSDMIGGLPRK